MPVTTVSTEGFKMRTVLAKILASVATLLVFATAFAALPDRTDLTGRWECDDGGTYYIRQVGSELWWRGISGEAKGKKKAFENVFHGNINGKVVTGSWADDPKGESRNAGILSLEIIGDGKNLQLKRTKETGGFGGGTWTPHKK
jgi:hypothetical protein